MIAPLELVEVGPDGPPQVRNRWAVVNGSIVVSGIVVGVVETELTVFVPLGFEVVRGRQRRLLDAVAAGKRTGLFVESAQIRSFDAAVVYRWGVVNHAGT